MAEKCVGIVQGTSTCTQCWSSSRPRLLRATSWAVTTPTSSLRLLLALLLRKDDHRVVQPRGKPCCPCLYCCHVSCFLFPIHGFPFLSHAVACVALCFHGHAHHMPWPLLLLCHSLFEVSWPLYDSCVMIGMLFVCCIVHVSGLTCVPFYFPDL